jgi:chemotaxis signal transduction protein
MLTIKITHTQWAIPLEKIHYIDYTEKLTLLPFASSPIEGLTQFNNQPIVQINLVQASGLNNQSGNKRVIISTPQGNIALKVDEVLNFVNPNSADTPPPLLELNEILSRLEATNTIKLKSSTPNPSPACLTTLLVTAGGKTVALSSHTIDHIEEIHDFQLLDYKETQPDLLIKVKDDLLPAYSLTRFLNCSSESTKQKAVIVRGSHSAWALVVEQVLALENIYQIYTTGTDTHGLWYITKSGEIREIINANQLIGEISKSYPVPITQPQWTQPLIHMAEQSRSDGLRVECGNNSYVLPMTIVQRTLDWLNHSLTTRQRFPTPATHSNRKTRIPWINGTMLLTGKCDITTNPKHVVLITFSQQRHLLFGVEHALLQPMLTPNAWIPLTHLPFPTVLFFDAATYDERAAQWILRVREHIEFSKLPWSIKKAFVTAIMGWIDLETITAQHVDKTIGNFHATILS